MNMNIEPIVLSCAFVLMLAELYFLLGEVVFETAPVIFFTL